MAAEVLISGSQNRAKVRNSVGVWALSVITLGVYSWFWWYFINREMRDLGRAKNVSGLGDNPWVSCAAWTIGAWLLYIPFVWTIVTTSTRIGRSQRVVCDQQTFNGWIAGLLWIFTLGIGGVIYTQWELNKVWATQPELSPTGLAGGDADLARLEKLTALKDSGAISQEEFDAEKSKLMPQAPSSAEMPPLPSDQQAPAAPPASEPPPPSA